MTLLEPYRACLCAGLGEKQTVKQMCLLTVTCTFVLDLFKIRNMAARGFAFGLASHGIGTARAMSKDSQAGVFAAVAMGLSGIITAAIIPFAFIILGDFTGITVK